MQVLTSVEQLDRIEAITGTDDGMPLDTYTKLKRKYIYGNVIVMVKQHFNFKK